MKPIQKYYAMFGLLLSVLFLTVGCQKDPIDPPVDPTDTTSWSLKTTINNNSFTVDDKNVDTQEDYTVDVQAGNIAHLYWKYTGKQTFELLKDGVHYSSATESSEDLPIIKNTEISIVLDTKVQKFKVRINMIGTLSPPVIHVNDTTFPYNAGNVAVKYKIDYADSAKCNGKMISPFYGAIVLNNPKNDTTLNVEAWGPGGHSTETAVAHVLSMTLEDFLKDGVWPLKDLLYGGQSVIASCELDNYWLFLSGGVQEIHEGVLWCGNKEYYSRTWYILPGDSAINISGGTYVVLERINNKKLVLNCVETGFTYVFEKP